LLILFKEATSYTLMRKWNDQVDRLIAAIGFAFVLATSAQAITPAPIYQPDDSMISQVAFACGPGRTRVGGVCVARTTIRQTRRCIRWTGTVCAAWRY